MGTNKHQLHSFRVRRSSIKESQNQKSHQHWDQSQVQDSYAILTANTALKQGVQIIMDKIQSTTHYDPTQLFGSFQSFRQSCNNFLHNAIFIGIISAFL